MKRVYEKSKTTEVVKGNSDDFVKKAEAVDKKPINKHSNNKKTNKKPSVETENKSNSDKNEPPKVKNTMTRAQIAKKKYGVESTWRPFEIFFNNQKKEDK